MDESEQIGLQLKSAHWYAEQATSLIAEYKACKTENAKHKLLPKIKHMYDKLHFEAKEIKKLMGEGDEWKNE